MGILISSFIKSLWQSVKTKKAVCTQIVMTGAASSAGKDVYSIRMMKHRNLLLCLRVTKKYAENKAFNLSVRNKALSLNPILCGASVSLVFWADQNCLRPSNRT